MHIDVVIPSKNGLKHLQECLPTVVTAARKASYPVKIIVVDDHSTDETLSVLPAQFPTVTFLSNNQGKGACSARNTAVALGQGEWIVFLDNDVFVEDDFFNTLSRYLQPDGFCVTCAGYSAYPKNLAKPKQLDGIKLISWKRGFPRFTKNIYNKDLSLNHTYNAWGAQGAYFACNRQKFNELGGFDSELFDPYLLEETDLVYRGLKRGWKIIYAADTHPRHKCGGTIQSKSSKKTHFLSQRNRIIFVWKNIHSPSLFLQHICFLVLRPTPKALWDCLKKRSVIMQKRKQEKEALKVSDRRLLCDSAAFEQDNKRVFSLQALLDRKEQLDYLQRRLQRYKAKYETGHQIALHLIGACLHCLRPGRYTRQASDPEKLFILFTLEGGMGDLLIALNYICYFYERFKNPSLQIGVYFPNRTLLKSFLPSFCILCINKNQKTDLHINIIRCPIVKYANLQKIKQYAAKLLPLIRRCLTFESEYHSFLQYEPYFDAITQNIYCENKKRYHQPDILNEFNITEKFILPIEIKNETAVLEKFNLTAKKYITVNREVGMSQVTESTKLWPLEHYRQLIELLKQYAPDYQIIEIGIGKGIRLGNAHQNLTGKTSLEELKVLLKLAALHIDSEGGQVHLRHALAGGPSCVFFGPTSPEVYGYSENLNLHSNACPICCEFYNPAWQENCMLKSHACMQTLSPQDVFEQIKGKNILK